MRLPRGGAFAPADFPRRRGFAAKIAFLVNGNAKINCKCGISAVMRAGAIRSVHGHDVRN
jgi:hypothetical protein